MRFRAHSYQSILAVPSGHCQYNTPLSRLETYFFHKVEDFNTLGRRSDCRVHLVFSVWAFCGVKPHKKCPQFFWRFRIYFLRPKVENYDLQFWAEKMCRSMYFGLRSTVNWFFGPKINLKNFRFWDLEKFQNFFKNFSNFFQFFFQIFQFLTLFLEIFIDFTNY